MFPFLNSRVAAAAVFAAIVAGHFAAAEQGQIVFVCNRSGADNLCLASSSGAAVRQITTGRDLKGSPRWSPDRRRIAFHQRPSVMTPGEPMDIYIVNSDGSGIRNLTNSDGSILYRNPAWSRDGSRLALECGIRSRPQAGANGLAWRICIIGADGTGLRTLTDGVGEGGNSESPDWSPDGTRIVFHSTRAAMPSGPPPLPGSDIYVMQADGSNVRRLTTTRPGRTTQNPAWSPDAGQIAFASTRDGDSATTGWDIHVMRADGTNVQRLTRESKPVGHPRWSPDGRQLVFHSTSARVAGTAADVELYVIGADGTNMRRLTENQLYDGQPDW